MKNHQFIKDFNEVGLKDINLVGGKNASLGEMIRNLNFLGIKVPSGFIITADAYTAFITPSILNKIDTLLNFDISDIGELNERSSAIRKLISQLELPSDLVEEISQGFRDMIRKSGLSQIEVAVRSSATAEDLPQASFAGQQESFLNIRDENELLEACKNCFASLFTARAISYRKANGIETSKVRLSIGVQRMVRADLASSGVIFTLDTESGANNVILVTSSYGLGENIVGGKIDPDEFWVSKSVVNTAQDPILRRKVGNKQFRLVFSTHGSQRTTNKVVSGVDQKKLSLNDSEVLQLARQSLKIEEFYSKIYGSYTPMDIEWAKDGLSEELFILQARPETVHSRISRDDVIMTLEEKSEILLTGKAVGRKVGSGQSRIINSKEDLDRFLPGEILVTDMTDPDWEPVMKKAAGIVTNRGGRTCHAAIVSREHGVPCVVGTGHATEALKNGQSITVSCCEGEVGHVYRGILSPSIQKISHFYDRSLKTKVYVNLGNPDEALKSSVLPVDGVGLTRMEFIIAESVKIHPMALIHPEKLSPSELNQVHQLTGEFKSDLPAFFVRKLSEGIAMIAGAFYPRPVIVRMSDFKTNEYANLIGGKHFEPIEENPMIGFRGASRYYNPLYAEGFALECKALSYVRNQMGLTNVKLMIPFCRSTIEAEKVIAELSKNDLKQGEEDLEVYVMCELPSNVLDAQSFAKLFDGFSIGSNDLTQMTLGVDRDSEIVSSLFDERDPAAFKMIKLAVEEGVRAGVPVGICGQAPSDYPEICQALVSLGITSISLSPDSIYRAIKVIADAEKDGRVTGHLATN